MKTQTKQAIWNTAFTLWAFTVGLGIAIIVLYYAGLVSFTEIKRPDERGSLHHVSYCVQMEGLQSLPAPRICR